MRSDHWKTYRTRFLVKAKQLKSNLSFTDHLGRQHCGRKGDYLVESCDGILSIAPRQIFEDIYVPMSLLHSLAADQFPGSSNDTVSGRMNINDLAIESLSIVSVENDKLPRTPPRRIEQFPPRLRRKSPQPVRSARTPPQLNLM